jgi:hypothetical protein
VPGGYQATATITVYDANEQPVYDARVESHWEGCVTGTETGYTDENGQVTHTSWKVKNGGTFTLCVDDITKDGWIYDPAANDETCDSDTSP